MYIPTQLTTHAAERLKERLGVSDPLAVLQTAEYRLPSVSISIGEHQTEDGEYCNFRLFYVPCVDGFAVLVVKRVEDAGGEIAFNVIKTVITAEMFELKFERSIDERSYRTCARLQLGVVEYRNWVDLRYGGKKRPNQNSLKVSFRTPTGNRVIWVKVRSRLCDGFKRNERIENSLAHPGALTIVHETLAKFSLRFADRTYMRFDSEHGLLKMDAREARECPHCGATPLPTDLPDSKVQS